MDSSNWCELYEPDSNSWTLKVKFQNAVSLACDQRSTQNAKLATKWAHTNHTTILQFRYQLYNFRCFLLHAMSMDIGHRGNSSSQKSNNTKCVSFVKAPRNNNNIIINEMKWWLTHALWLWLYHWKDVCFVRNFRCWHWLWISVLLCFQHFAAIRIQMHDTN